MGETEMIDVHIETVRGFFRLLLNRTRNGRNYQFNASPMKSDGSVSGTVLLLPDVTEKEQSELLENGIVKPEDVSEFSEKIYSESRRILRLIEDIIKLSRPDEGAEGMEWESVDLYALSGDVINSLSDAASSADVTLKLTGKSTVINGIPQLLQTMIFNLCDKSIMYNQKGGTVEIDVKNGDNVTALTVCDTGMGIPPECIKRVFERFYRVDKSRSREVGADRMSAQGRPKRGTDAAQTSNPGGTGSGLSIVKHAAKIHNAEIKIGSVVGKGTSITVVFPRV